jgi:predicted GNAT family acetyltransferase
MIAESSMLIEQTTALSAFSMHPLITTRLTAKDGPQVLRLLAERALHNAVMMGLIMDNGLESKFNRGTFYGCRDAAGGKLSGVALIGHGVFIDARSHEALRQFVKLAQNFPRAHMLMGEQEMIERFWTLYAPAGQARRRLCREVLFELTKPADHSVEVENLRLAQVSDLPIVMPVHAAMALEESGVNPLDVDADGFRERCQRRIEKQRTWVLVEHDKLLFKADIISDTADVVYLEGVYVDPDQRGKGLGSQCLMQLTRTFLNRSKSVSVLVNQERRPALAFYEKLGFVSRGLYDTIFLRTDPSPEPQSAPRGA